MLQIILSIITIILFIYAKLSYEQPFGGKVMFSQSYFSDYSNDNDMTSTFPSSFVSLVSKRQSVPDVLTDPDDESLPSISDSFPVMNNANETSDMNGISSDQSSQLTPSVFMSSSINQISVNTGDQGVADGDTSVVDNSPSPSSSPGASKFFSTRETPRTSSDSENVNVTCVFASENVTDPVFVPTDSFSNQTSISFSNQTLLTNETMTFFPNRTEPVYDTPHFLYNTSDVLQMNSSAPKGVFYVVNGKKKFYPIYSMTSNVLPVKSGIRTTPRYSSKAGDDTIVKTRPTLRREKYLKRKHPELFGTILPSRQKQGLCPHCIRCNGTSSCEPYFMRGENWKEIHSHGYDVTAVIAATYERLSFLKYFVNRWKGPLIACVKVLNMNLLEAKLSLQKLNLPSYFSVIFYIVNEGDRHYEDFPVNLLRNVAIRNVVTTHFLVLDMDMWPCNNLRRILRTLPTAILKSKKVGVIIPAVFSTTRDLLLDRCTTLEECAQLSDLYFPKTKDGLQKCIKDGRCTMKKGTTRSHLYVSSRWIKAPAGIVFQLECYSSRFQEPYLMLPNRNSTLLFDERFVNYGCNKVQYADHLRYQGYQFFIPSAAFATDVVHHDSVYRQTFDSARDENMKPDMAIVCYEYMAAVKKHYDSSIIVPICQSRFKPLYSVFK